MPGALREADPSTVFIVLLQLLIEIKSNLSALAKSKGRRIKLAVGERHVARTDLQD
jgi:hypothetical protein